MTANERIKSSKSASGLPSFLAGAVAGGIATGPMTLTMMEMQRRLPAAERSPFPPATIVVDLLKKTEMNPVPPPLVQATLAVGAHFAYGTAAGALYAYTFGKTKLPVITRGLLFGGAFWGLNYLGIAPSLDLRAAAPKMPARRNAMMLGAHLVWGIALAYAEEVLRRDGKNYLVGARRASAAE